MSRAFPNLLFTIRRIPQTTQWWANDTCSDRSLPGTSVHSIMRRCVKKISEKKWNFKSCLNEITMKGMDETIWTSMILNFRSKVFKTVIVQHMWNIFNHSITEFWISYESIMDSLEILFLASFLQMSSRMIFLVSRLFTILMSMKSSFLDDVLRNWKKVHRIIDELLIRPSFFVQ